MTDAVEWILGTLAIVLCGAAFAVGGQVIREAWRGAFKARPRAPPPGSLPEPGAPASHAHEVKHKPRW